MNYNKWYMVGLSAVVQSAMHHNQVNKENLLINYMN